MVLRVNLAESRDPHHESNDSEGCSCLHSFHAYTDFHGQAPWKLDTAGPLGVAKASGAKESLSPTKEWGKGSRPW